MSQTIEEFILKRNEQTKHLEDVEDNTSDSGQFDLFDISYDGCYLDNKKKKMIEEAKNPYIKNIGMNVKIIFINNSSDTGILQPVFIENGKYSSKTFILNKSEYFFREIAKLELI